MSDSISWRILQPGQRARIRVWDRASGEVRTVHETEERLYEAPNWLADGRLLINGDGKLWFLAADGSTEPELFDVPSLPPVNNDHVLVPDGTGVYASANDHHIWHVPFDGSEITRVTSEDGPLHFLHGVSPDGTQLAYVRVVPSVDGSWSGAAIHLVGTDGTGDRALTAGTGPADGSAWTPDGEWILFNTEQFSTVPGHAQLARIRPDGHELVQLTSDERVNWFPHVAPTGDVVAYVSFEPGTIGHPENRSVELRLVQWEAWDQPTTLVALHGGQGTMNVPSWAPDGSAFAFVDYPVEELDEE